MLRVLARSLVGKEPVNLDMLELAFPRLQRPLSLINSESLRLGPEQSRARSEAKPIP